MSRFVATNSANIGSGKMLRISFGALASVVLVVNSAVNVSTVISSMYILYFFKIVSSFGGVFHCSSLFTSILFTYFGVACIFNFPSDDDFDNT